MNQEAIQTLVRTQLIKAKLELKYTIIGLITEAGKPKNKRELKEYDFYIFTQSMLYQICKNEPFIISERDYNKERKNIDTRQLLDNYLDTLQLDIKLTEDNNYILTPTDKLCEKREAYKQLFNIK